MKSFQPTLTFLVVSLTGVAAFIVGTSPQLQKTAASTLASPSTTSLNMAIWSDPKAVKEYQEFLSTGKSEVEMASDSASVIIVEPETYCDMADALFTMGMGDDLAISPYQDLPEQMDGKASYPIYITLPPNRLAEFIENLPESYLQRAEDFVFFSGGLVYGNIEEVLRKNGFCRDTMTQVLASGFKWFAETKRVDDLGVKLGMANNGEEKWGGQCTACGKWQGAIAERMLRNDVICKTHFYRDWRRYMWEDSIVNAVFNLLGVVREEPTSVANVANYYYEEAGDMIWEMSGQLRGWKALTLTFGFEERMYGVAEVNGVDKACVLTDEMFPFILGMDAFLQSKMYVEYLHYAQGQKGCLPNTVLPPMLEEASSIMRSGNLRADGVV